jgi:hypothetical protein
MAHHSMDHQVKGWPSTPIPLSRQSGESPPPQEEGIRDKLRAVIKQLASHPHSKWWQAASHARYSTSHGGQGGNWEQTGVYIHNSS